MKPLLITTLLAVFAPVASANDFVDFHKKLFRAHRRVAHAILHRRHHRHHDHGYTRRVWVPVRYEVSRRRVFIPGTYRRVWYPARYETRYDDCNNSYRVLVGRGYWDTTRTNGHYEWRRERVRRGGYYETIGAGHRHGDRHRDRHHRYRR